MSDTAASSGASRLAGWAQHVNWPMWSTLGLLWAAGFLHGYLFASASSERRRRGSRAIAAEARRDEGGVALTVRDQPSALQLVPRSQRWMDDLEAAFHVSSTHLYEIVRHFVAEMELGLTKTGSSMKMIPSFVERLPTGNERGSMLALDLGGSNFRVVQVMMDGNGQTRTQHKKFVVSDELKVGHVDDLFDFLADCIKQFLQESNLGVEAEHFLGFTFSFPVRQHSINSGELIEWTKGFSIPSAVNQDVCGLLDRAIKRKGMNVKVAALVNDTVGTLVAHAYQDIETVAGVILGTGSNAAYVEKLSNVPKWDAPPSKSGLMIINMEWGNFDYRRKVLPITRYDVEIDERSPNPGKQLYEKLISGMYLGEILRVVLVDLAKRGHIFRGEMSKQLETPYGIDTAFLSRIERDHSLDLHDTRAVIEELLGIKEPSSEDCKVVKRVSELVGIRAARLSAAGVAGVVTKTNRLGGCTVAVDGSVFEKYPHFANRMNDALIEIFGVSADAIRMVQARDGSSVGAGLIAMLASQS